MLPQIPHRFDFIHIRSRQDLPHLGLVVLLISGIVLGVYLSLQPQIFSKRAAQEGLVAVKFEPEVVKVARMGTYETKIAVDPKAERVTAIQLEISYDPEAVTILEAKNEGFLPITLKTRDSLDGTLTLIYGGTVETQATSPGVAATLRFKFIGDKPSLLSIKPGSQVSVSSKEGNVLNQFASVKLDTGNVERQSNEEVKYPDNLLLEEPVIQDPSPFVEQFREALEPKPEIKPERVEPELSERYILQLGRDIFVEPIVALNEVIEDKAAEILQPE